MREETLLGKAWIFGDNIDTDAIIPGRYLHILDRKELASHTFEFVKAEFKDKVRGNDIIIAGKNFGCGSSREHAVLCLKESGIGAIVALSYGRIFFRNAINNAVPVLKFDIEEKQMVEIYSSVFDCDEVELDFSENILEITSSGTKYNLEPLPDFLLEIIDAGGLIEYTKKACKSI